MVKRKGSKKGFQGEGLAKGLLATGGTHTPIGWVCVSYVLNSVLKPQSA